MNPHTFDHLTTSDQDRNTISGPGNSYLRARVWVFTLNNPTQKDIDHLTTTFSNSKKYIFQKEIGESKTEHLQGVVQYINKKSFSQMKKINMKCHWEICKNVNASFNYCQKEKGRIAGPWGNITENNGLNKVEFYKWKTEEFRKLLMEGCRCLKYDCILCWKTPKDY